MPVNLPHAVQRNKHWAREIGWGYYREQISKYLGMGNVRDDETFIRRVAAWQKERPPLSDDGIIGPATWAVLQAKLRDAGLLVIQLPGSVITASPPPRGTGENAARRSIPRQSRAWRQDRMSARSAVISNAQTELRGEDRLYYFQVVSLGRFYGRLHATLLFLCERFVTNESAEALRSLRQGTLDEWRNFQGNQVGIAAERSHALAARESFLARLAELDGKIAFAEAREVGTIVGVGPNNIGLNWTSNLPLQQDMKDIAFSVPYGADFTRAWDEAYESQYYKLNIEPLLTVIALCIAELACFGAGLAIDVVASGALAAVARSQIALSVRSAYARAVTLMRTLRQRLLLGATRLPRNAADLRNRLLAHADNWRTREATLELYGWSRNGLVRNNATRTVLRDPSIPINNGAGTILGDSAVPITIEQGEYLLQIPHSASRALSGNPAQWISMRFSSRAEALQYARSLAQRGRENLRQHTALPEFWSNPLTGEVSAGNAVSEIMVVRTQESYGALGSIAGPQRDAISGLTYRGGAQQVCLPKGWRGVVTDRVPIPGG
jgi:hypothetical protein